MTRLARFFVGGIVGVALGAVVYLAGPLYGVFLEWLLTRDVRIVGAVSIFICGGLLWVMITEE